jgi:hypothetical protein
MSPTRGMRLDPLQVLLVHSAEAGIFAAVQLFKQFLLYYAAISKSLLLSLSYTAIALMDMFTFAA